MFHRIGHLLLITALLAGTGGHWALLQTVAWTNMLAANLQTCSLSEALSRTFDGRHPCCLCKTIAAAKKAEKKTVFAGAAKKLEFTHAISRFVFAAPTAFWLQAGPLVNPLSRNHAPPVPPPRPVSG